MLYKNKDPLMLSRGLGGRANSWLLEVVTEVPG